MLLWVNYIKKHQYCKTFKKDTKFEFRPGLNILVGDQGSGKSTLLKDIFETVMGTMGKPKDDDVHRYDYKTIEESGLDFRTSASKGWSIILHDSEKNNPRIKSYFDKDIAFQISSMYVSHGESHRAIMRGLGAKEDLTKTIIMIDEPDVAMSPMSIVELYGILKRVSKKNQVILAAHNPLLMLLHDEVLDIVTGKFVSSQDYLNAFLKKKKIKIQLAKV